MRMAWGDHAVFFGKGRFCVIKMERRMMCIAHVATLPKINNNNKEIINKQQIINNKYMINKQYINQYIYI